MAGYLTSDDLGRLAKALKQLNRGKYPDLFVRSVSFDMRDGDGGPEFTVEVAWDEDFDTYGGFVLPLTD